MALRGPGTKREALLLTLLALFVGFFVTAEILGAKLWEFRLFGLAPADLGLGDGRAFVATAGILAFPLTFLLTDIVNEYFGFRVVRTFTWLAIAVNVVLQPVILTAAHVTTWSPAGAEAAAEAHRAYQIAFGQTWAIVVASLVAFGTAQLVDATVFTWLRRRTGGKMIWLRAQGSTVVSQLVDTLVVIYLAFYVIPALMGQPHMSAGEAGTISLTNYVYKFLIAVVMTPLLYGVHAAVEAWLGKEEAEALARAAHPADPA